ncbi:MAG TPA: ABC transporter permease [Dongiaceae bacterium]|jgi:putative spermidine/putrescine transport system permease protein
MALAAYASPGERVWYYALRIIVGLVLLFLIAPIIVITPLSLNAEPYFSYPMPGLSARWYEDFFQNERWQLALRTSLIVAFLTTILATSLGTIAALGLSRANFRFKPLVMALLISPMIVPLVITAVGMYFRYASMGLTNTITGLVLAHTALATPFVVIVVTATLTGFDHTLTRAGASLGAPPWTVFFRIIFPLILPGLISGALFAFGTSFDEVIVAIFISSAETRTLPKQMFSGIREVISPTITAAATFLIFIAIILLTTVELLRRRSERLRGIRD